MALELKEDEEVGWMVPYWIYEDAGRVRILFKVLIVMSFA